MTRLYNNVFINQFIDLKNKTQYFQKNILSKLCILLSGFLSANLFGTVLSSLRHFLLDVFIVLGLILLIESISYFRYKLPLQLFCSSLRIEDVALSPKKLTSQTFDLSQSGALHKEHKIFTLHVLVLCKQIVDLFVAFAKAKVRPHVQSKSTIHHQSKVGNDYKTSKTKRFLLNHKSRAKHLNLFKIGAMIGFFVDAFKVGS